MPLLLLFKSKKMKNKILFLLVIISLETMHTNAQPSYPVTDTTPVTVNGLLMGYHIKSAEEKQVSDKGNFSRYSMQFYITNTTSEAKIILYKEGWNVLNNVSDYLARFDCFNATGARFTSKSTTLEAAPCNILAQVDDKDCASNKTVQNKRFVQIGYWIKPGQIISASTIMIVPLNELPKVTATFLMNSVSSMGSAEMSPYNREQPSYNAQQFFQLKNVWKNTFLNVQYGPVTCTDIDSGWWSAQWQVLPVSGTNYFTIKNRWKNNYISLDPSGAVVITANQVNTSLWLIEPIANSTAVRLKNSANNTYLNVETGNLQSTQIWNDAWSAQWVLTAQ